jgi:hypothetical protein
VNFSAEDVFHPNLMKGGVPFVSQQPDLPKSARTADRPEQFDHHRRAVVREREFLRWRNRDQLTKLLVQAHTTRSTTINCRPSKRSPILSFDGGYVEGGWVISGEPTRYSVGDAAFANPFLSAAGSAST